MIPQEQIKSFFDTVQAIRSEIAKEIIGQERVVEQLLTALIVALFLAIPYWKDKLMSGRRAVAGKGNNDA